ncbi:hypothetical protein [Acidithiobacillus sp.]|uniref:hypothetical protein n=1 Tax=Acidithiobacillus sp. TaxID=1872118 RepID=UPI003D004691
MNNLKQDVKFDETGYSLKHKTLGEVSRGYRSASTTDSYIELEAKRVDVKPFVCSKHGLEIICGVSIGVASW